MVNQQNLTTAKRASNPYLVQTVRTASKEKLILILYQLGVQACVRKDAAKANRILSELIGALNFDYREMSIRFFDIYRYTLDEINSAQFSQAEGTFRALGEMWESTLVKGTTNS